MKKLLMMIFTAGAALAASAQTMNIVVGEVTYQVPATQAGDMPYTSGTQLTVLSKTFEIDDIDSIYIDNTTVTENAVSVTWNGTTASVVVPYNIMSNLTVTADGSDVSIVQDGNVSSEITYTLSGTSSNGSFYMDGELKATFILNGLTLTNTTGAAINIEDGKRIAIQLADGTTNTLSDGSGSQKACLMVNGHAEFTGGGALILYGNYKHAYWGDEYVLMKKAMTGTITIAGAVKDGFNINQYFEQKGGNLVISGVGDDGIQVSATDDDTDEQNGEIVISGGTMNVAVTATAAKGIKSEGNITISGGTLQISTTGGGEYDAEDADTKASACIKSDANIVISDGTLTLKSTGSGGKGINCDSTLTISGGTIDITTTGKQYVYGSLDSSPKGIKANRDITISGGTITVSTMGGEGSEGIESKAKMYVTGGTIEVNSYDDGLNSGSDMHIQGGKIYVRATNNDGLDANGNLYIEGGTLVIYGGGSPECGLDANEEEGYKLYITGGTVIALGGRTSYPNSISGAAPVIVYGGSLSQNNNYALCDASGNCILDFTMVNSISGGGPGGPGGGGGSVTLVMASPSMVSGTRYTLYSGSTGSGDNWHGLYESGTVGSTSLGSVTAATPYASIGNSGGGPGGGGR